MTAARKASYILFAAIVAAMFFLRLGPVALAGLFSYMILDIAHRRLYRRLSGLWASWLSVLIFLVIATGTVFLFVRFIQMTLERIPMIMESLVPKISDLAAAHGIDLPFDNLHDLRIVVIESVKDNARSITRESGLLTKGFFQILTGIVVAVMCFLSERGEREDRSFFHAVRDEFGTRVDIFMDGFEKIMGAQVIISLINTGITAIFLLSIGVPYVHFLTLSTFIFGVIPIVGNILSNTMIVCTALTVSPELALIALTFLVVSHKVQYFLSGQILGSRIKIPVWQILLGLLIGESIMGVPGMILAPALLNYLREEMLSLPESWDRQGAQERATASRS